MKSDHYYYILLPFQCDFSAQFSLFQYLESWWCSTVRDDFIILSLALICKEERSVENKDFESCCGFSVSLETLRRGEKRKIIHRNIMFSIRSRSLNIMKTIKGMRLESSSNKMFPDENWLVKNRFLAARGWLLMRMAELDSYCDKVNAMKPPQTNKEGWQRMTDVNILRYNSLKALAGARASVNYLKALDAYKSARYSVILGLGRVGNSFTDFLERKFKWYFWLYNLFLKYILFWFYLTFSDRSCLLLSFSNFWHKFYHY